MADPLTTEFDWTLDDGAVLHMRPIRSGDKELLQGAIPHISAENLYRRFFMPVVRLSDDQLRFLTEVDQVRHIAWCALVPAETDQPLAGVCRCVRIDDEPGVAEAAILVVDAWQHRGIGTLLLATLSVAAAHQEIRTLRSYSLEENVPFLHTMLSLGAVSRWEYGNVRRIDLPVYDDLLTVPRSPRGRIFRNALAAVQWLIDPRH